ncbi:MAG: helix-turn-helix domain-containing protein [Pseudomonadales bacterium]
MVNPSHSDVPLALRNAREASGLSLRALARRAGTSHATLIAYEKGRKTPGVDTFVRILEAAGFAVDFNITRRIREHDGLARGEELEQVLRLAEQFPARVSRAMEYPRLLL